MSENVAIDYIFTDEQADMLAGCALMPADMRWELLHRYAAKHGSNAILEIFAQFIGLANSVVENNREMIEMILIVEGGMHPYSAEKANLPTIFGGLTGVKLANKVRQSSTKVCGGCAFRRGSPANQCPSTVIDAEHCLSFGEQIFSCHEHMDDKGEPTKACGGYAMAIKQARRSA